jgi:VWFA-related protein
MGAAMRASMSRKVRLYGVSVIALAMCPTLQDYGQSAAGGDQGAGVVSVPVLVAMRSGELAYDLSASDFSIRDNGIEQRVSLEGGFPPRALSLVLVIQNGRGAGNQLETITHPEALVDSALTNSQNEISVISFDSRPQILQGFTHEPSDVSTSLGSIAAGNSGAALFDAVHIAVNLLRTAPEGDRKVIVLISGEHDHGSNASDIASLIRDVAASNASVYSLCFKAGNRSILGKLSSLNPVTMTASAMQRNAAEALAQLTGGEFYRFASQRTFGDRSIEIANHISNRYMLSFRPSRPDPGFHSLQVGVGYSKMDVLSARSGYWIADSIVPPVGGGLR